MVLQFSRFDLNWSNSFQLSKITREWTWQIITYLMSTKEVNFPRVQHSKPHQIKDDWSFSFGRTILFGASQRSPSKARILDRLSNKPTKQTCTDQVTLTNLSIYSIAARLTDWFHDWWQMDKEMWIIIYNIKLGICCVKRIHEF